MTTWSLRARLAVSSDNRWLVCSAESVAWREWDGEMVVHVGDTGSTHLLNARAATLVLALLERRRGMTLGELTAQFRGDDAGAGATQAREPDAAAVREALAELERIGLLRRA